MLLLFSWLGETLMGNKFQMGFGGKCFTLY